MDVSDASAKGGGGVHVPKRFIFSQGDMGQWTRSAAYKELLAFVSAMGQGVTRAKQVAHGGYHPGAPLEHLTPALSSLSGSLACMSQTWLDGKHGGIPPDTTAKVRFGNPAFRTWHARLIERSHGIVKCLMDCHVQNSGGPSAEGPMRAEILRDCYDRGYQAAAATVTSPQARDTSSPRKKQDEVIAELRAYLHDSFGHPVRLDYGTGHESSFVVLLLSLCKLGCFRWGKARAGESTSPTEGVGLPALSLFHHYLNVTRGLQKDYMLEPAGSHGVWGLDDYHCVPFYLGACQMVARENWQRQVGGPAAEETAPENESEQTDAEGRMPDNPYLPNSATEKPLSPSSARGEDGDHWGPSIIQDRRMLDAYSSTYLYLSCIKFIQQIKPSAPFFEASPMLNDISQLDTWAKVSAGLLRLYEGEVISKMPVVQHFVFGEIFKADWTPSRSEPLEAPPTLWASGVDGTAVAPTRAPWAK